MSTLPVPDTRFQDDLRRDSSVQVDLVERTPSPRLLRSEIGIQAEIPVKDIRIEGKDIEMTFKEKLKITQQPRINLVQ